MPPIMRMRQSDTGGEENARNSLRPFLALIALFAVVPFFYILDEYKNEIKEWETFRSFNLEVAHVEGKNCELDISRWGFVYSGLSVMQVKPELPPTMQLGNISISGTHSLYANHSEPLFKGVLHFPTDRLDSPKSEFRIPFIFIYKQLIDGDTYPYLKQVFKNCSYQQKLHYHFTLKHEKKESKTTLMKDILVDCPSFSHLQTAFQSRIMRTPRLH